MIHTFGYVMLIVQDMQRSVEFYQKLLQKKPDFTSPRWSQFAVGKVLIGLHAVDSWSDPNDHLRSFGSGQKGLSFGLYVDDINGFIEELSSQKISIAHGPRMTGLGNTIYLVDPDGYYIQLCQPNVKA